MKGHGEKLTRKKYEAIAALLECTTVMEAARKTGISKTTLWRWYRDEDFQTSYQSAKKEVLERAISLLHSASAQAVVSLMQISKDRRVRPSSRVTAAKAILELAIRAAEFEELERRISRLEKGIEEQKGAYR